jgi:hypothetical protein
MCVRVCVYLRLYIYMCVCVCVCMCTCVCWLCFLDLSCSVMMCSVVPDFRSLLIAVGVVCVYLSVVVAH